jgi:Cupin-like domain
MVVSEYAGERVWTSSSSPYTVDRVASTSLTPADFFERYIARRKPCILRHDPENGSNEKKRRRRTEQPAVDSADVIRQFERITPSLLERVAGSIPVQIEHRSSTDSSFGQNREKDQVQWTIAQFLHRCIYQTADSTHDPSLYYLSTQHDDQEDDKGPTKGPPQPFFATPCRQLVDQGHIPSSLPWSGHLQLQSCHLWLGATNKSSSGLHHDFHDNFYVLVRGSKHFVLYDPSCAPHMYLHGDIHAIHPNGLISYQSHPTHADGRPYDLGRDKDDDGSSDPSDEDDDVYGKPFQDADSEQDSAASDDYDQLFPDDDSTDSEDPSSNAEVVVGSRPESKPKHFSRVVLDSNQLDACPTAYPLFPDRQRQCVVSLEAGEMLYLPASWFHCVTSKSDCASNASATPGLNYHLAINYWYHPPDHLSDFDNPYQSDFWKP